MVHHDAAPPPRAAIGSPPRRSSASPARRSHYSDATEKTSGPDLQYPPGFDLNGFEDIILPPASALTTRATAYSAHPQFDSDEDGEEDVAALASSNTFLERCRNTALNIPTTATLTQNSRATLQASAKSITSFVPTWGNRQEPQAQESTNKQPETKLKRNTTFGDLFAGSSAPINIGIIPSPDKEKAAMDWISNKPPSRPTTNRTSTTVSSASTSKFSWFGTKAFNPAPTPIPSTTSLPATNPSSSDATTTDALLTLTPTTALFPHGPTNPLDPSSYNALLHNATTTIDRLQTGYRAKCNDAALAHAEASAQTDEAEEAETRARHLKRQLDDMAARVAEQEEAMRELAEQLARERLVRREEEEARRRSVMLVRNKSQQFEAMVEREMEREREGGRREGVSRGTSVCDSGFESDADAESTVDSVFSRPGNEVGSPMVGTPLSTLNEWESDGVDTTGFGEANRSKTTRPPSRTSLGQRSAGLGLSGKRKSGMSLEDYMERRLSSPSVSTCSNCNGGSQTNAWTLVSELRIENKGLNGRVSELERTVEGCLDLVAG
ncbi:MAG: hypothetical protein Q9165_004676 [Trypethelium subeluteriae]